MASSGLRRLVVTSRKAMEIQRPAWAVITRRWLSDSGAGGDVGGGGGNITYSGGQATEGQGGFYGAGGARASMAQTKHRPEALAHAEDIKKLRALMEEVYELEDELSGNEVELPKKIQIKAAIKKKMASRECADLLKRLELKGAPVWGLSTKEREMVREARRKLNAC